jgi:hypothetical protein
MLVRPRESELTGRKRADFLACNRRVVVETKSLEVDPVEKIQRFLDGLAQSGRLPKAGDTTLGRVDEFDQAKAGGEAYD